MKKKVLCTALAVTMLLTTTTSATAKPWWLSQYRVTFDNELGIVGNVTLTFASDGGSFVRPITKRYGESISLESYVPTKHGYTFKGWFTDPRTKQNQVTTFKFTKPDVLYAKWEKNPQEPINPNDEIMAKDTCYLTGEETKIRNEIIEEKNKIYIEGFGYVAPSKTHSIIVGNMVNHRKEKPFKSKKFRDVPRDEWIVVENTHEPIIDKQTFDEVQKLLESRARETKTGETQIFAKIIKCMDCKKALVFSNATKSYVCNTYNLKGKKYCPSHYIRYDELYGVVLADIYAKTVLLETDRDALYKAALKCNEQKIMAETKDNQRKLAKANKRIDELELLIKKTYENSVLGNLSSERMASLLAGYEEEQAELKAEASRIESELNEYHKSKDNAIDFVNLIEKYIGIKELTYEILHELIDRIEVGEKYEYQGETYQDINIYYKFVGTVEFNSELNIEKAG